jgi:hypothetical protein
LSVVTKALLASTSPNSKHRTKLEAKGVRNEPVAPTPEQQAAEDAGVAAVMAILGSDEVCEAVGMLGHLPRTMLAAFQEHDPIEYPQNTLAGFERDVMDWVWKCMKAARDE